LATHDQRSRAVAAEPCCMIALSRFDRFVTLWPYHLMICSCCDWPSESAPRSCSI
jgi:hypothetical protein